MMNELMTHLWQSTLFAAAAGLLTIAFRKNGAKVRFWLWLSASLKFFVPFALLMNAGGRIHWVPAKAIATSVVTFAVEYVADPFPVALSLPAAAPRSTDWEPVLILGIWACGFLTIALIRLRLWLHIRGALRQSVRLESHTAVEIRSCPGLLEPGVVGLFNPVLLLPEGITERLTPSQLEAVLAHELCHVRRRDNMFASIHMIVEAIFWFHPLVWWIGARLLEERERACDEDVLSLGNQPRDYADAILNVCRLYAESSLVCVSGVTGSGIKRRIEAIMTNGKLQTLNRARKIFLTTAGVAALVGPVAVGVLIGIGHTPMIHAQPPAAISVPVPVRQLEQAQLPAHPNTAASAPPADRYQDHRLVAMLLDFGTVTSDDRSRLKNAAREFIYAQLKPNDLVCVMTANSGRVNVAQDFTGDRTALESTIRDLDAGNESDLPENLDVRLASIETAAKMLVVLPEKKALMYFSRGIMQSGTDNQAQLLAMIDTAKKANVAIYPIDLALEIAVQPGFTGLQNGENDATVVHGTVSFGAMGRTAMGYTLIGGVGKTGAFPLTRQTTVLDALAAAGGFKDFSRPEKIVIMRGTQTFYFNYNEAIKGVHMEQNIILQDGDLIIVPE